MKITVHAGDPLSLKADLLVIPVLQGSKKPVGLAARADKALDGLISEIVMQDKFEGREGEHLVIRTAGKLSAGKVALLGAGLKPFGRAAARKAAARAARLAREAHAKKVIFVLDDASAAQAATEGTLLGDYRYLKYKDEERKKHQDDSIEEFILAVVKKAAAERGVELGIVTSRATIFSRELVNEPALEMTPSRLVAVAKEIAAASPKRISLEISDKKALEKLGMGGLLAVARGSDEPPFMVHLTYKPKRKAKKRLVLVGKGITFDSGGLSLKPSDSMEDMKIDMAGCAAVLGVFSVLAELDPEVEVHGISGICENMPSGKAIRPGDIVRTMSGKTIEILNTDAEGRVTLADTLFYGSQLKPDLMIDLATLTGACMVALGEEVAGVMSNSDRSAAKVLASAAEEGELMARLPLVEEYRTMMKSQTADLKNISGGRYGGAITAGLFLDQFVDGVNWVHIDMAGPAWAERDSVPHQPLGATGFGVRTVLNLLMNI